MNIQAQLENLGIRQIDLASRLGVTQGAISQWLHSQIPAERVLAFERATGIPRHALRPDLYPRTEDEAA